MVWSLNRVKWGFQDGFRRCLHGTTAAYGRDEDRPDCQCKELGAAYHGDGRAHWTFAVQIVFKDVAAFVGPSGDDEIEKRLFPDRARFLRKNSAGSRFSMALGRSPQRA